MKCPVCNINLVMSERSGVEIDYCPECRGVWLDRGELDKIIERSSSSAGNINQQDARSIYSESHHDNNRKNDGRANKRRESFLGDLFDF